MFKGIYFCGVLFQCMVGVVVGVMLCLGVIVVVVDCGGVFGCGVGGDDCVFMVVYCLVLLDDWVGVV